MRDEAPPLATPLWFGDPEWPLFGFSHAPLAASRPTAVVIVPPLGYEALCAHAALRRLAEYLAERGFFVLRYDHPGSGDSAGDDSDPDRVRALIAGVGSAIDAAKAESLASEVSVIGLRMGGLLALAASERRKDVKSLVLWAPPDSGRSHVRELRALGSLGYAGGSVPSSGQSPAGLEAAGFLYSPQTLADLAEFDPRRLSVPAGAKLLVIPRDDAPPAAARGVWATAELKNLSGYSNALRDPHESSIADELLTGVAEWLEQSHGDVSRPGRPLLPRATRVELRANQKATRSIVEEAVRFGPGDRLFGILTHRSGSESGPCLIWLNAGAIHHVGMNRNYVGFARALAERGVMSLRFDLSGLGDSQAHLETEGLGLYSKRGVADVRAAMDFLERFHGVERSVLVGLCAGAYAAFHTAVADPRVSGAIMINPQTFDYRSGDSLSIRRRRSHKAVRWYRRAAVRPESWGKVLRGQVDLVQASKHLLQRADALLRSKLRRGWLRQSNGLANALDSLCERGTRLLLVYSADDPGLDHLQGELGGELEALRRHAGFSLEIIDGPDHTFSPLLSQVDLSRRLSRHLAACHGAEPCAGDSNGVAPSAPFDRLASLARRSAKHTASKLLPSSWLIVHGSRSARRLALTFDDGPTELTRAYLDVLAQYRVPASFFLVGRACERFPDAVLDIARSGHAIGSHGFTHKSFPTLGRKELLRELARTDGLLPAPHNGRRLVRPPHGAVSPRSLFDCTSAGYSTVLWSYDSGDSQHSSASELLEVFDRDPPKSGDIILLHEDHRHTLDALKDLIERLLSQRYELVTVSDLFR